MFKNCLLKSDNYGPIMTLGLTRKEKIIIDSDDNILNFKGEVAAVIHQYDRKPELVKKVKNKYCPEIGFYEKLISNNYEYHKKKRLDEIKYISKKNKNIIHLLISLYFFGIILVIKRKSRKLIKYD